MLLHHFTMTAYCYYECYMLCTYAYFDVERYGLMCYLMRRLFLLLARLLFMLLLSGMGEEFLWGPISLVHAVAHSTHTLKSASHLPTGCIDDGNTDYPGAVDCIVRPKTFDCNLVPDKAPCTYEDADRPTDYPVDYVVIHDIEGTASRAISTFHNVRSLVSIHYIVDSNGTIYQLLHDTDIAYHAGNYWYNQRALGIENVGYAANGYQWYNAAQYQATARLTAYLLNKYHIPLDRGHVIGHGNVPSPSLALMPNHVDPGPYWLWDYYFSLINSYGIPYTRGSWDANVIAIHPASDLLPLGAGGQELPQNYNFFTLYNGPSTASGQIPHAGGDTVTDETGNIEPGSSYAYTNQVIDPAGSGDIMYQIWYGVEMPQRSRKLTHFAQARQVWLAIQRGYVTHGVGIIITLNDKTKIYGKPTLDSSSQIGEAPAGAVFDAIFTIHDDKSGDWYTINFNHRQAWVLADDIDF